MKPELMQPYVIGPDGERMTLSDLPAPDTERWVPRRKARVVAAVEGGLISEADARALYGISSEEFGLWRAALISGGLKGLRVTRVRQSRPASE
jgi:hypothetical protein